MYIKVVGGVASSITKSELRTLHPNVSFPRNPAAAVLVDYGVFPYVEAAKAHNKDTEVSAVGTITEVNGVWTQGWTVRAMTAEESAARLAKRIRMVEGAREAKEGSGLLHNGNYFDTATESQGRLTAAITADGRGSARGANGVWKTINATTGLIEYKPMNPNALGIVADLVTAHIQKCFDAEKATIEKLYAGDWTADYETEFAAL